MYLDDMNMNDSLGDRIKQYETVAQSKLIRRMPVIIRIDGKAFHTWVKNLDFDLSLKDSPFSKIMHKLMTHTTNELVENVQNCIFGYTQSDEISLLLKDWTNLNTEQWFDAKIQKITSVSASMATVYFNEVSCVYEIPFAMFDARVFNLPKEEVVNYFIWRQNDASRNSVQMLARFYYSHKEVQNKNNSELQDMLMLDKNINWNDIETWKKRGTCIYKEEIGNNIIVDEDSPIFTKDRNYIERFL